MLAINIPKRMITFKSNTTDRERYIATKNLWKCNLGLIQYAFPKFILDYEDKLIPIPNSINFNPDMHYQ